MILKLATSTMIAVMLSSCSTTKIKLIHKDLRILSQCNFEKFTDIEKDSMIEDVGIKIWSNQENCRIRQKRITKLTVIKSNKHARKSIR